uniref:Uncharacterized protein n=1 Tax=Panagrolaimus sp. ES5 TaxID=591445 RepID=A0AC34FQY4_9BILA
MTCPANVSTIYQWQNAAECIFRNWNAKSPTPEVDGSEGLTTSWPLWLTITCPANVSTIYKWQNAAECMFRNWNVESSTPEVDGSEGAPNSYKNSTQTIAAMSNNGFWNDQTFASSSATPGTFLCKESALSLAEYAKNCNTIDSCEQLQRD